MTRIAAIAVVLAAALLLLLGATVLPWWSGEAGSNTFRIDLRGMTICQADRCSPRKALAVVEGEARVWSRLGTSTFAASLVAAALLGLCAIAAARQKGSATYYWLAGLLSFFAGVSALLFFWLRPELGAPAPSYGGACTVAGAFLGATAASVLARRVARTSA